jgi:PPIC-type peptidyl-prolyl cis-trans isomerase-like protein
MNKARIAALAALVSVTACEGLKEAMTAHVDVVARAEKQELSVQRLADMLGRSQVPLAKPVLEQVADVWVSYQLLAKAASVGDSMTDTVFIDKVMKPVFDQSKTQRWMQQVTQGFAIDTSSAKLEAAYNEGTHFLSARHILFQVPQGQAATGSDSVMKRAEAVRRQINDKNFAALAKQHGSDGTKDQGGDLGVFPPQQMVPEFSQAVAALKPGEIGPLIHTQFGYHIVRRNTFEEARQQFAAMYAQTLQQTAQSTYFGNLEKANKVQVKPNAGKAVKELAADPQAHKNDRTAIATSSLGNFTVGDVAELLNAMPGQQRGNALEQLKAMPDSVFPMVVPRLMLSDLLLKQADSAGIKVDTAEVQAIRNAFKGLVRNTWAGLRITPELLADSAKTPAERERLAAARVDAYMDRLLQGQEGFVDVPPPLAEALREKYDGSIKPAGVTRALEVAQRTRASADSSRAASQPKSSVPMPPDTGRAKR